MPDRIQSSTLGILTGEHRCAKILKQILYGKSPFSLCKKKKKNSQVFHVNLHPTC